MRQRENKFLNKFTEIHSTDGLCFNEFMSVSGRGELLMSPKLEMLNDMGRHGKAFSEHLSFSANSDASNIWSYITKGTF